MCGNNRKEKRHTKVPFSCFILSSFSPLSWVVINISFHLPLAVGSGPLWVSGSNAITKGTCLTLLLLCETVLNPVVMLSLTLFWKKSLTLSSVFLHIPRWWVLSASKSPSLAGCNTTIKKILSTFHLEIHTFITVTSPSCKGPAVRIKGKKTKGKMWLKKREKNEKTVGKTRTICCS